MTDKEGSAETFADDTTLTILREEGSIKKCIKYIEEFSKISSLAENLDNTNLIPFGK